MAAASPPAIRCAAGAARPRHRLHRRRRDVTHCGAAYDLAVALAAGVEGFAHVPSFGARGVDDSAARALIIPDSSVQLAGARRVKMTATLALSARSAGDDTVKVRRFTDVTVRNARALRRAGVMLLAGSDTYSDSGIVRKDPSTTARVLGLSALELLRLWAVDTPTAVFPGRRIGRLRPGFASSGARRGHHRRAGISTVGSPDCAHDPSRHDACRGDHCTRRS